MFAEVFGMSTYDLDSIQRILFIVACTTSRNERCGPNYRLASHSYAARQADGPKLLLSGAWYCHGAGRAILSLTDCPADRRTETMLKR